MNLLLASGMITALLNYAAHDRYLVVDDVDDDKVIRAYRRRRKYLILIAVTILVGLIAPVIALGFYIALALGFIVQPLIGMRRKR